MSFQGKKKLRVKGSNNTKKEFVDSESTPSHTVESSDNEGGLYDSSSIFEAMKQLEAQFQDDSNSAKPSKLKKAKLTSKGSLSVEPVPKKVPKDTSKVVKVASVANPADTIAENLVLVADKAVESTESEPAKLTKQQKRDLKRNRAAAAATASELADSATDSIAHLHSAAIPIQSTEIANALASTKEEGSSVYKRTIRLPPAMPHIKTAKRFLVPGNVTFR